MSVNITSVDKNSPADKAGIIAGEILDSINGNEIVDVLDYRFYQNDSNLLIALRGKDGTLRELTVIKDESEELGLEFDTYLMDRQKSCRNKCIFCFIDQLPKGMRESLYFKDDDSRMSFLFGNYITLTNITEHEVDRIIKMHISPVNISVHTTNPELRVKMMKNRFAGEALSVLWRLSDAGIELNCQLVLVPGWNDGAELVRSLSDLSVRENIKSIACVPVGLTAHREGLPELHPFTKEEAAAVIDTCNSFGDECKKKFGSRKIYPADEFFLLAERPIPDAEYYEDFAQLENGVGMWASTDSEASDELQYAKKFLPFRRNISAVTGEAAYPLIKDIVDRTEAKWHNLKCTVYPIKNEFFGGHITVTGLVTATDIIKQLKGKNLGSELLVPSVMLRNEGDKFLDDLTVADIERVLGIKVRVIETDGKSLVDALLNIKN